MNPRAKTNIYRYGVDALGVAAFAASLGTLRGRSVDWPLTLLLVGLGLLAHQFPLHVSLTTKISVAYAVVFAIVLLYPPAQAGALVAAIFLVSGTLSALKKRRAVRSMPLRVVLTTVLFNASQAYLAALGAAATLLVTGSSVTRLQQPESLIGVLLAGTVLFTLNQVMVAAAYSLSTDRRVLQVLRTQLRVSAHSAGFLLFGLAAAAVATLHPLAPLLLAVPTVAVHVSLTRRIQMREETIRKVEAIADAVDRRDPYTNQHSRRVAEYSTAIGRRIGLMPNEVEQLRLAATVHDVGKIKIPDSILLKPGRLTEDERREMELHPRLGFDFLSDFAEYASVRDLVLTHHERFDGGGYPNGFEGRGLRMVAQVMPVADSLDAMTSDRPYRKGLSWTEALAELERGAGTQWNPQVVSAAVEIYAERARSEGREPRLRTLQTA